MRRLSGAGAVALALLAVTPPFSAQPAPPCTFEPLQLPAPAKPIPFTPAQEMDLGDAIAEHVQRSLNVVDDARNDYLQQIGDRILKQLPVVGLTFRIRLVDQPYWNAFAMPGGRIYVTRKLVAFARSEDELAGVLAHEIGHVAARHSVADLSETFRKRLGMTTFGDRADIFAKYRHLVDRNTSSHGSRGHEENQQLEADYVALVAAARAGYSPAAFAEVWDRYTETEGKTGNFFSDLFGATRPESRRLREMLRTIGTLPTGCTSPHDPAAFTAWQASVIESKRADVADGTVVPLEEIVLAPALRSDLTQLRFSPDGTWVLAQDDSSVYVLSREPLAVQFRIDVDGARPAQFTPDSRMVLVHTEDLRVEWWDLAKQTRARTFEVVGRRSCLETALSPDGRVLGCVASDFTVVLLDVETGETLFKKERVYQIDYRKLRDLASDGRLSQVRLTLDVFQLAFSPDGRYFIVGNDTGEVVVDVAGRTEAKLPDSIKRAFRQKFAFLGSDRLVTVDPTNAGKSSILRYPGGDLLGRATLAGKIAAATHGDFILLRPLQRWPVGLADLQSNKVVLASKSDALDAFDRLHLSELPGGQVGLFELGGQRALAVATLPKARLDRLETFDLSPELKWLAISGRDRGAVWNVETGARALLVQGFQGVHVEDDGATYADFPKRRDFKDGKPVESQRRLVRLEAATQATNDIAPLSDDELQMVGRFITLVTPASKERPHEDLTLEIRDARSNATRWTRRFAKDAPEHIYVDRIGDRVIVAWSMSSSTAKHATRDDARLRDLARTMKLGAGDVFVEAADGASGTPLGQMVISTGKDESKIRAITSSGDALVVTDRHNQVIVYSLASSARLGSVFGTVGVPSERAQLLCVQNEANAVELYDLKTLEHRQRIRVPAGLRLMRFNTDGTRLLLLSADQIIRVYNTTPFRRPAS